MPFDVSLVFRLEFYPWIFDDYGIVLLEALATVFLPKARDDIFERFVLSKQALVLTAALDGGPASDKGCHLLEDFAGPEQQMTYLRCNLSFSAYLLKRRQEMNLNTSSSCQRPSLMLQRGPSEFEEGSREQQSSQSSELLFSCAKIFPFSIRNKHLIQYYTLWLTDSSLSIAALSYSVTFFHADDHSKRDHMSVQACSEYINLFG